MTILSIAIDLAGAAWLATTSGIWRGQPGAWIECASPPLQPSALVCAGGDAERGSGLLLVGGPPGGIMRSTDRSLRWEPTWIDEVESAITCLVLSPRFAADQQLLAGTTAAGVLRSVDGGRHWRLSNAGLRDQAVLALAAAPGWDERELVFAATIGGLYRSPNAGRAWKLCANELSGQVVQTLAVGPTSVYAGSESGAILRSSDSGTTWQQLAVPADLSAINALWLSPLDPALVLAGCADGAILRSVDHGQSWIATMAVAREDGAAVLALAGDAAIVYAGCADGALYVSRDAGQSWAADRSLVTRVGR